MHDEIKLTETKAQRGLIPWQRSQGKRSSEREVESDFSSLDNFTREISELGELNLVYLFPNEMIILCTVVFSGTLP